MNDLVLATPIPFPSRTWRLTVIDAFDVAPRLRRLRLVFEEDGFAHRAGQSLVLGALRAGARLRRPVPVAAFDAEEQVIDLDVPLEDPHLVWAATAKFGDPVTAEVAA